MVESLFNFIMLVQKYGGWPLIILGISFLLDEKSLVNFGPLTNLMQLMFTHQISFFENHILAHKGCCALKFLHTLENDQGFTHFTRDGDLSYNIFTMEGQKLA